MKEQIGKKRKKRKLSDEREELKGYLRGRKGGQGMNETKGNKSKQPREKREERRKRERERERRGENGDQSGAVYLVFAGVR